MTQLLRYEFHLFGPRKGQDIMINGHVFEKGVCHMVLDSSRAGPLMRGLSYYGAYAKGTPAFDDAERAENGIPTSIAPGDEQPSEPPILSFNEPTGGAATKEEAPASEGTTDPDGGHGDNPARDGHEHSGFRRFEAESDRIEPSEPEGTVNAKVREAVMSLDPNNDDHWTKAGIPALLAVEEAVGRSGTTRQDVESAARGYTRELALAAQTPAEPMEETPEF